MAAAALGFVYFALLAAGSRARGLAAAALAVVACLQGLAAFFHVVALRMAMLIGTFPTFGFIRLAFQGEVVGASLLAPENLPFTAAAAVLVLAAMIGPIATRRRWGGWPGRRGVAARALALAVLAGAGFGASAALSRDLSQTGVDPVLFFAREAFGESSERRGPGGLALPPGGFPRDVIAGDAAVERTAALVDNRDEWRRTNRNVVLIVLESTPARQASFAEPVLVDGEERDTTPTLRGMRENMLLAENHYAVHPTSMADLFSLACSLYPYPMRPAITDVNPRIPCVSISELLDRRGYAGGLFFSGHFSMYRKDLFYRGRGFDEMHDALSMPGRGGAFDFRWGVDERVTVAAALDFVRQRRDRPFFVQYIQVFPHAPYEVPPDVDTPFGTERPLDRHHNSVRYVDAAVGAFVDGLRELDLLDDTLIVVVADHGEAFREHPGNRVHSMFIYDENVRVPLAFYNPLLFSGSPSIRRVSSHVDVLPTIADLLDLPADPLWQGSSLVRDGPSRLAYFYSVTGRQLVGLRDGRYKVIWDRGSGRFEIFDLDADPLERRNLAGELRDRVARYREALAAWRRYQAALIPGFGRLGARHGAPAASAGERGVTPLTDLVPVRSYQPHPYDPMPNFSVSGMGLDLGGVAARRGLGVHADSVYTYDVGGLGALRLVGRVGRDHRSAGAAEAMVFLDGVLAFSSGELTRDAPAHAFDLDLRGVREVSLVAWQGVDGSRSDHVDWAEVLLVTDAARAYRPGDVVWLDREPAAGASGPGLRARPIAADDGGLQGLAAPVVARGLVVPAGASISYDLRHLGATRLLARLLSEGLDGAPPAWVEIAFDGHPALRLELRRGADDDARAVDLEIPAGSRVVTIGAAPAADGEPGGAAIVADLRVLTSAERFEAGRRIMARDRGGDWPLLLVPLAPPAPPETALALGPLDDDVAALDEPAEREVLSLAAGATARWDLAGLGARRLRAAIAAAGPAGCRVAAAARSGERSWASDAVSEGEAPVPVTVELTDGAALELESEGDPGCAVRWARPTLLGTR